MNTQWMKKTLCMLLIVALTAFCALAEETPAVESCSDPDAYLAYRMALGPGAAYAPFAYENDPADHPRVMADAVQNPDAVFGFSPSPESARLREYVDALDWTNPEEVAQARAVRAEYHASFAEIYAMIADMLQEAKPVEEIARAVSQRRNELRLASYGDDPEALARIKQSNLDAYGNELGLTADSLYEKYGSWQTVLEKALGTNAGMDACLGFFDEYFELYDFSNE